MPVILDPQQQFGTPEIVYVTAHTSSATTATVLRAQEGSTLRAHDTGEYWVAGPTALDFNKGFYGARMYRNAPASYGATTTVLQYDTISYDPSSSCTLGANAAYTAVVTGYYLVTMNFGVVSSAAAQQPEALIYVNGSEIAIGSQAVATGASQGITSTCFDRVHATAGQLIQGFCSCNANIGSQVGSANQYIAISLDEIT
jgi:hypothetical protein